MPVADHRFLALAERFLHRRAPGRALVRLARAPVPVLGVEAMAARRPEPGVTATGAALACALDAAPTGRGALDGADVVVKDAIDVAGAPTTGGVADGGVVATADATMVARVRAAGGRVIGKGVMTELGMDGVGALMPWPVPANPAAPGYFAGGSSTGVAAAVAGGLARYGIGSDGLGSVRIPAAYAGLYGLKPGRSADLADGYRTSVRTLDVCGPLARTAADCARLWQVMRGLPIADVPAAVPPRVGAVRQLAAARACRSIQRAVARMLAALGVAVDDLDVPGADRATFLGGLTGAVELADSPGAARPLSPAGRMNVALGRAFAPADRAALEAQRAALVAAVDVALARVPVLVMPTTAIPPPALSRALMGGGQDLMLLRALGLYTPLANLCDLPAIAAPCGVDDRGRPLSIMFVGRRGDEGALLAIAAAVEATGLARAPV